MENKAQKILVIEDNPGDAYLIAEYLQEEFVTPQILHAKTSAEAQQMISTVCDIDVVLLDLTLPDDSGQELIDKILKAAHLIPVIVLTGYSDKTFAIKSITLGTSDYLLKDDLNPALLSKSIIYSIERKKSYLQLEESEKRYKDLFHLSPLPMWVFEESTAKFLDVNQAALAQYGYTQEEFLTKTVFDIRPPEEIFQLKDHLRETSGFSGQYNAGAFRHLKKSGEIIDVEISVSAINFDGKSARLILAKEVTQQKKYISTIEEQNNRLKEIAWIQSHVVRAPLARLMGLVNILTNLETGEEERKQLLGFVAKSANDIDDVIKKINDKTGEIDLSEAGAQAKITDTHRLG